MENADDIISTAAEETEKRNKERIRQISGIVTSIPIVGGITASGVFLLFISVIGLIGRSHNIHRF